MAIISTGTVSLTQGSNSVSGVDTLFITDGIASGDVFKVDGDPLHYTIASVSSETVLLLQQNYASASVDDTTYQVLTDFYQFNLIKLFPDMTDSFLVMNRNYQIIAEKLGIAGASAIEYQYTTRFYLGIPTQGTEFGFITWGNDAQIDKISLSTDLSPPDNNLVLDISIDGTYQNLNLTLPAGSFSVQSASLSYQIANSDAIKFKWTTVTLPAGSDYYIDIQWHAITALSVRYDFIRNYVGALQVNQIIGNGYYPPVKSTYYAIAYELTNGSDGSTIILELLKNGASIGTPVTVTIPAQSLNGYITHSQTNFETTDTYSWKITQVGSTFPGENIIITSYSFRIE